MRVSKDRFLHSIETPVGCRKYGWKWDRDRHVCIQYEEETCGCLAPVKGLELCWEGIDLYNDIDTVESWRGKYLSDMVGISTIDGKHIVNSGEWGFDFIFDSMKKAVTEGKDIACDLAADILKGKAADWCLLYKSPSGEISKRMTPNCSVTDADKKCKMLKPFRFRRGKHKKNPS